MRISGQLPGLKSNDPASYWTRQETTRLTEGHFTIAVPEGLTQATILATRFYMRKEDKPEFVWKRSGEAKVQTVPCLELGTVSEPLGLAVSVRDAPKDAERN